MRLSLACPLVLGLASALWAQTATPDSKPANVDLPVTKAVLFSSGVGYFEHTGSVDGDAAMRLMFKTAQINDVLKSMVLMDESGGQITSVTYGANEPIARALKSFGVDISNNPSLPDLLNQLRGAAVEVSTPEKLSGSILNVESNIKVVGNPPVQVTQYTLNLVTDAGLRAIPLESISNLRFAEAKLREELNQALALVASARDTERKPVDIKFAGKGKRQVRVGYLIETPVWKTSYRLDLSPERPILQGWAIVENTTDNDWSKVDLSLISGRPISFVQDLYTPLYLNRPVVKPSYLAALTPRLYEEGIAGEDRAVLADAAPALSTAPPAPAVRRSADREMNFAAKARPGAPMDTAGGGWGGVSLAQAGVTAIAYGAEAGEMFRYTVPAVDLARRRSAMLPIITGPITAEKVSIYNQSVDARKPLVGVYLTNSTKDKMLPGPVTVFDGGIYGGDAQIDYLQPGDKRLLAYAQDLDTLVDPSVFTSSHIVGATFVKGVLTIQRVMTFSQTYTLKNKAEKNKTLIVEHPFTNGRKLVAPEQYEEKTPTLYRFRVALKPGAKSDLVVKEEQPMGETIVVLDRPVEHLIGYSTSNEIPPKVRDALVKAMELKSALTDAERELQKLEQELRSIKEDQERLRRNISTVGRDSVQGKNYLDRLGKQEARIEKLEDQEDKPGLITQARQKVEAARAALEKYLMGLNIRN